MDITNLSLPYNRGGGGGLVNATAASDSSVNGPSFRNYARSSKIMQYFDHGTSLLLVSIILKFVNVEYLPKAPIIDR